MPAGWPFATGQDHLPNHALAAIDYAGIHLWPDVWSRDDRPWGARWIQAHAENAALLGKPLVIEEFGKFVGAPPLQPPAGFLSACRVPHEGTRITAHSRSRDYYIQSVWIERFLDDRAPVRAMGSYTQRHITCMPSVADCTCRH